MQTQTKTTSKKHRKLSYTWQLVMAVLLFMTAVFASRGADMMDWEVAVFEFVYGLPEFLKPVFFVVTQTGSIHAAGILVLGFLLSRRYHIAVRLLLTTTLAYLFAGFAKDIWGRLRPHEVLANVVNLDYVVRGPGFPSGHMAMATALALTVGRYLPKKYRPIVPIWIVGVGLSRLYLGIHAPLDVIGGFAIGWASYALFCHVRIYNLIPIVKGKRTANGRKKIRAKTTSH